MAIAGHSDDQHSVMRLFLNHPHHFIIYITVQDKLKIPKSYSSQTVCFPPTGPARPDWRLTAERR